MNDDRQLTERKQECGLHLDEVLRPLLYTYGPVVLREQVCEWLERAPRNRDELRERNG